MTKYFVIDTNVLLDTPEAINGVNCVILSHVLRELESHKLNINKELAYKARNATRYIDNNLNDILFDVKDYQVNYSNEVDSEYVDNKVIQACIDNDYGLITNDLLLKQKAKGFGVEVSEIEKDEDDYSGYTEVKLTDEELAYFYENPNFNIYDLLTNQYLIIQDKSNQVIDAYRWNGTKHVPVTNKTIHTTQFGKFKPKDIYQKCAIDGLFQNDVMLLHGKAGSGKSLIALTFIMNQIENGKLDRLICLVNPVPVRSAQEIGFYKGSKDEKLLQSSIGNLLISKFGDLAYVEAMIQTGKLVLIPYSDIRGYDTGDNSAIWISEAQNLSVDLMKLGLQRIGEGSKVIIDGDVKTQLDNPLFAGVNNGVRRMSKVFRGTEVYGEVEFKTIYRSKIADIADKM